jgi:PHD/YefM family antitoxin component YafN of YafNO toxin-antitoxin module
MSDTFSTFSANHTPSLSAIQLRQQLGEVLERVHYQFASFRIMRKDRPMARLVNERYMQALDHLIKSDPALADTLAILLNDEAMEIIEQGMKERAEGKLIPLAEALHQK